MVTIRMNAGASHHNMYVQLTAEYPVAM